MIGPFRWSALFLFLVAFISYFGTGALLGFAPTYAPPSFAPTSGDPEPSGTATAGLPVLGGPFAGAPDFLISA